MFLVGIGIHLVFLFTIFDIYFKSPIVKNVEPYKPRHNALADRLVLFVVDGLRAESFVNHSTMPYLRSIANSHGRWGVSHTRMPTESRPGHVAVIAGFYEDPSAIVKGWKENPVDFDSVFNQSLYTWCWGTYDIIEIFTKGSNSDHIFAKKMDPYDQTFSSDKNTTHLDAWVFDNVRDFFSNAKSNDNLYQKLRQNKIIFFLHLLGTDTSGHTHKPKSPNFLSTVRYVDEGIKEIEKIIRNFYYDDNKTTFLMTSDHGMTDWGSHGAGLEHETQTPYVIWGAGVKQTESIQIDPQTQSMSLEHRLDINQADLTPLMSTILSIPVPVNSIGQLPANLLNFTMSDKAKAVYSNSRQLASQYNTKRLDVEKNILTIFYKPYPKFCRQKYHEIIDFIENMLVDEIKDEQLEQLILLSEEIMSLSLAGLNYYHNYYQRPLLVLVTLSFIGWIVCLLKFLLEQNINTQTVPSNLHRQGVKNIKRPVFLILLITLIYLIYVQNLPVQYYLYVLMPIFLWIYALSPLDIWLHILRQFVRRRFCGKIAEILCYLMGSLALGMSFTHRWMLSIPLLGMGLWPFISSTKLNYTKSIQIMWPIGCILLSIFSFTPVVGKSTYIELVLIAGVFWLLVILLYTYKVLLPINCTDNRKDIFLTVVQAVLLILTLQNVYVQQMRFERGTPLSYSYQTMAWIIAITSLILPVAFSTRLISRLIAVNTSLITFYLLLSVSHEGLFMVALIINVTCWLFIEFSTLDLKNIKITDLNFEEADEQTRVISIERSISNEDFRRSFIFIVYIILAFFGTGNIASLNSFEVRWVTCFITSFKPFIITGLIMLKTLAPFMVVACSFRGIQILTKAPSGYLNIIVLIYSNIMGIQLLYNVKNTGSWLDIGTSISQFVIVQVVTLFIVLINQIAKILTDISIYNVVNRILGKSIKKYV